MAYKDNSKAIAYNNDFIAKSYDRVNLTLSKGKKETIKAHAEAQGQSVNSFINQAIDEKIERDTLARKRKENKWSDKIEDEVLRIRKRDGGQMDLFVGTMLAIGEYGLEDDVWEYLKGHPTATFNELERFISELCPPIEIVDDDES